jgi:acyl dehydratase
MAERELERAPSILPLLVRAGVGAVPGARRIVNRGDRQPPTTTALTLNDVAIDRDQMACYARVCGFDVSDALPATYPHVLAFGLQMALLTDPGFTLPAVGLVHIANRIEQQRPIDASQRLSLRVWREPIEPHPRGRRFTIGTEVRCGDQPVWSESSTMLHRGGGDPSAARQPAPPAADDLPANAAWRLGADQGRRYAAVSGDHNPIHLNPLTARLLGFPRPIVHGMWCKARCLAALGPELPGSFVAQVAFKRPVLLPAKVTFGEARTEAGAITFGVRDAREGTPHLDGLIVQTDSVVAS